MLNLINKIAVKSHLFHVLMILLSIFMISCGTSPRIDSDDDDNNNTPDYLKVFPNDKVNRIDIKLTQQNWQIMIDYMIENFDELGSCSDVLDTFWDDCVPYLEWSGDDPPWVPCDITFEEETWQNVGMRFKGKGSLITAWMGWGNYKLPFKLDFDQFEDQFPETNDQRLFGFKKIGFSNNVTDPSHVIYKASADLLFEEGVTSPQAAFYRVFFDIGEGPIYFGLYTATEIPDNPMFNKHSWGKNGNLYKYSHDELAAWRLEFPVNEVSFPKRTNKELADWSDIQAAVNALHASHDSAQSWRTAFEERFDAVNFVKSLAVNASIWNWDLLNHYIYASPEENGKLHWIPYDFDMAFPGWDIGTFAPNFLDTPLTIDYALVSADFNPLLRFILDDDVYWETYIEAVRHFRQNNFEAVSVKARLQTYHDMIAPYVIGVDGELPDYTFTNPTEFQDRLDDIFELIDERHAAIDSFLSSY